MPTPARLKCEARTVIHQLVGNHPPDGVKRVIDVRWKNENGIGRQRVACSTAKTLH